MTLNEWAAARKTAILASLKAGRAPEEGEYDEAVLREARVKGEPQMGATRYEQDRAVFEFIYPDPLSSATVLPVTVATPERIVHLPVPGWVIEDIWQGAIDGSYHFESDALRQVEALRAELEPEANRKWFGPQPAKRRE